MAQRPRVTFPKRGEVYLVNFDPTVGAEIRKTRPALVLQNDIANRYSPITIVAAISSRFEETLVSDGSFHQSWRRWPEGRFRGAAQSDALN